MSKGLLHIVFILIAGFSLAQNAVEHNWKSEKDNVEYRKTPGYKGPKEWYSPSPANIHENYEDADSPELPFGGTYDDEDILRERDFRLGTGEGNGPEQPEIISPDPIELPDFDPPEIDGPDIDLPDVDAPDFLFSESFWKTILFILLFAGIIVLVYIILKNEQPRTTKVVYDVQNDWNPELVEKTELQKMLDKALENQDYRACVRIYFIFILKELGEQNKIKWQHKKTNWDYVQEVKKKDPRSQFDGIVRIYDLVWYGDYHISQGDYSSLQNKLVGFYSNLTKEGK